MQQTAELDRAADRVDVQSSRKRKTSARRKVTVRLSEGVCGRLDVATDRPGVGKSMLVEAALEHFLNPAPSIEALLRESFDDMNARFGQLECDMRMIAETVSLHARYHLAVVPPLPQSQQRQATIVGDERFKILAEQVDCRVRQRRPLLQETIDRLRSAKNERSDRASGQPPPQNSTPAPEESRDESEGIDFEQAPPASAKTDRRNPSFAEHPKAAACLNRSVSDGGPNLRTAASSYPESSTGKLAASPATSLSTWRLILSVFLPFAAGYYLSFLFRTINASISPALESDFGLGAAETGLLASVGAGPRDLGSG
jgi:hypothetical protein